jgi:zinc D-Ala-D-Ala dipeptidase
MFKFSWLILLLSAIPTAIFAENFPVKFVNLYEISPSIQIDLRYMGYHNFIGRPIKGYEEPVCILTAPAATALAKVQKVLLKQAYSLKVYDCYRPQQAVNEFIQWSKHSKDQIMKAEFYPQVDKKDFFKLGYVAERSSHTRGSTVDLTIVPLHSKSAAYQPGQALQSCTAPYQQRFKDNSIDMGTGYDCMDELSHSYNNKVSHLAYQHRKWLRKLMIANGFTPYKYEWWHFTLENEPYPNRYFNFPVKSDSLKQLQN